MSINTAFNIPKMAELCATTCENVRALRGAIDDVYNAFLDAISVTTSTPINTEVGYGGFYGVSDILVLSVYTRAGSSNHKTNAQLSDLIFGLADAMCARNGYGLGTSRYISFSGEKCPFVLFRQDNANSYFQYKTYEMQSLISGIYSLSNYIEAFFNAFYRSDTEDVVFISNETKSQIYDKIFDTNLRAGIPYLTKFYILPTNIFRVRQVISYAQYELYAVNIPQLSPEDIYQGIVGRRIL